MENSLIDFALLIEDETVQLACSIYQRVESDEKLGLIGPHEYQELREDIEELGEKGLDLKLIQELQYNWYVRGLAVYKDEFAQRVLDKVVGWETLQPDRVSGEGAAPGLLIAEDQIFAFLNREFLGEHYPDALEQVRRIYEQLAEATVDTKRIHDHWQKCLALLPQPDSEE